MAEEPAARTAWGGKLEFVLTLVGFAVGLGNVWRFPYLAYQNGGGAFLIPYVLTLLLVGVPLFYMETAFGQFASLGPVTAWTVSPMFRGVGIASIIVSTYILIYYNVIVSWCLFYFFASMSDPLPWITCNNTWNTPSCQEPIDPDTREFAVSLDAGATTPSEEYFYLHVLDLSPGIDEPGEMRWQLVLCLLLGWLIIFLVLLKGISSLGKVSYFVSIFPYILLTAMLVRGATLDGASKGIEFYMKPNFTKLEDSQTWSQASTQIFYSVGLGMGSLIAMASYNQFKNNIQRDAVIVPLINCCTSVYTGFVIFSVLGYMAHVKGVDVQDVAADGPGLVFVVYPEGLATMPVATLWAVLFFFMMTTLGFSSQFSVAEGVISVILDEFPFLRLGMRPLLLRSAFCTAGFLLGLPMVTQGGFYLFTIINDYSAGYPLVIVCILELVALQYVYGYNNFAADIAMMLGKKPNIFWKACWLVGSPGFLLAILVMMAVFQGRLMYDEVRPYPDWANALAWLVVAFPLVIIVGWAVFQWIKEGGPSKGFEAMKRAASPSADWGPALPENRTGRYAKHSETIGAISGPDFSISTYNDKQIGAKEPPPAYDNLAYNQQL